MYDELLKEEYRQWKKLLSAKMRVEKAEIRKIKDKERLFKQAFLYSKLRDEVYLEYLEVCPGEHSMENAQYNDRFDFYDDLTIMCRERAEAMG